MMLLRADAGPSIGVGHLSRCVALAEAAVGRGHRVALSGAVTGAGWLTERLTELGVDLLPPAADDPALAALAVEVGADVVVVDHYGLGPLPATRATARLVSIEDGEFGRRPADLVVDTSLAAGHREPDGSGAVLFGPDYAMLRDRVRAARAARTSRTARVVPAPGSLRVVVVMGGGVVGDAVTGVLVALGGTGLDLSVRAISASPVVAPAGLECVVEPPTPDLPAVCADADLVVSAAGVTLLELCCVGVPTALVLLADNQEAGYAAALRQGVAVGLGAPADLPDAVDALRALLAAPAARGALAAAGRSTVDGRGAARVLDQIGLRVRDAGRADAELLLAWRNDEQTRSWSRDSRPIALADHTAWLDRVLADPARLLLVFESDSPLGTVRFDLVEADTWEVSITLAPTHRGRGLSGPMLAAAEAALRARHPAGTILASVHHNNAASLRLFHTAGYTETGEPTGPFLRLAKHMQ